MQDNYSEPSGNERPELEANFKASRGTPDNLSATVRRGKDATSFHSPVDLYKLHMERKIRGQAFGLTPESDLSFENNRSFPSIGNKNKHDRELEYYQRFENEFRMTERGQGEGGFLPDLTAFDSNVVKQNQAAFDESSDSIYEMSDQRYYSHRASLSEHPALRPESSHNSSWKISKSLIIIDLETTEILVANKLSTQLLGYSENELYGVLLSSLVLGGNDLKSVFEVLKQKSTREQQSFSDDLPEDFVKAELILHHKSYGCIAVYCWFHNVDSNGRCAVELESVKSLGGQVLLDNNGFITQADEDVGLLFHSLPDALIGRSIHLLIPSLSLLSDRIDHVDEVLRDVQCVSGILHDGSSVPLAVHLSHDPLRDSPCSVANIQVYPALSGDFKFDNKGEIYSADPLFSVFSLGFLPSELIGKNVTSILPLFYESKPRISSSYDSSESDEPDLSTSVFEDTKPFFMKANKACSLPLSTASLNAGDCPMLPNPRRREGILSDITNNATQGNAKKRVGSITRLAESVMASLIIGGMESDDTQVGVDSEKCPSPIESPDKENEAGQNKNQAGEKCCVSNKNIDPLAERDSCFDSPKLCKVNSVMTSTPAARKKIACSDFDESHSEYKIVEGKFEGVLKHKDGGTIRTFYRVHQTEDIDEHCASGNGPFYSLWIECRYPHLDDYLEQHESSASEQQKGAQHRKKEDTFVENDSSCAASLDGSRNEKWKKTKSDPRCTHGDFEQKYTIVKQIGVGAYGAVSLSYRNSDKLLVVTKFLKKSEISRDLWVHNPLRGKKIPKEINFLLHLDHPNIVSVLDMFENSTFIQLVMESHGAGMDLFEFIDRQPKTDEPLVSYIFRQLASAVHFLHYDKRVIHRDIKDENVIIDHRFRVKLIDFGSATDFKPNHLFNTFYGTVEYCCPEVLAGHKYKGPELDVWALGVTLYVLVFGENPFQNPTASLNKSLQLMKDVSSELESLVFGMLSKSPTSRFTMQDIVDHPFVHMHVDIDDYQFDEVVRCDMNEAFPPKYFINNSEAVESFATSFESNCSRRSSPRKGVGNDSFLSSSSHSLDLSKINEAVENEPPKVGPAAESNIRPGSGVDQSVLMVFDSKADNNRTAECETSSIMVISPYQAVDRKSTTKSPGRTSTEIGEICSQLTAAYLNEGSSSLIDNDDTQCSVENDVSKSLVENDVSTSMRERLEVYDDEMDCCTDTSIDQSTNLSSRLFDKEKSFPSVSISDSYYAETSFSPDESFNNEEQENDTSPKKAARGVRRDVIPETDSDSSVDPSEGSPEAVGYMKVVEGSSCSSALENESRSQDGCESLLGRESSVSSYSNSEQYISLPSNSRQESCASEERVDSKQSWTEEELSSKSKSNENIAGGRVLGDTITIEDTIIDNVSCTSFDQSNCFQAVGDSLNTVDRATPAKLEADEESVAVRKLEAVEQFVAVDRTANPEAVEQSVAVERTTPAKLETDEQSVVVDRTPAKLESVELCVSNVSSVSESSRCSSRQCRCDRGSLPCPCCLAECEPLFCLDDDPYEDCEEDSFS